MIAQNGVIFLGVDLVDPYSKLGRPATRASISSELECVFSDWEQYLDGSGLVPITIANKKYILAVDGPQGLSSVPERKMRSCERLLAAAGKSPHQFPVLGRPFAGFVRGSVELFSHLCSSKEFLLYGMPGISRSEANVFEVYPGAAWKTLAGRVLPKKKTSEGRLERFKLLKSLGMSFPQFELGGLPTHDHLDAAVAAYIAYLFVNNQTVDFGEAPFFDEDSNIIREGYIVQPAQKLGANAPN